MKRPIAIGLSPNTTGTDVRLALSLLCRPWQYTRGYAAERLEGWFEKYFGVPFAVSFDSGRSALYAILKAMDIHEGDEVILQAFTCVVVPNAIIALGAKPVYVDIDETLTMNPHDLEKKITKRTKAVIVQHTFGIPTQMDDILRITKHHKIPIIEDAAHTIGGTYKGKKLGTIGVAALFSFGRDKAFSSTFGGIAITTDRELGKKMESYQLTRPYPSIFWTKRQLFYPVLTHIILSTYYLLSFGKVIHFLLAKIKFFSYPVTKREKEGIFTEDMVKRYPNALATLALAQLTRLEDYNNRRSDIVSAYLTAVKTKHIQTSIKEPLPLLRFPVLVKNKQQVKDHFAQHGIYLGDWYTQAIDPRDVQMSCVQYEHCSMSDDIARHIINFPTYPGLPDDAIVKILELWNSQSSI